MRDQASRCIENLLIDLNKIEEEFISKEDYQTASEYWSRVLFERQYYGLKNYIKRLHCGTSFNAAVEMLRDNLEEGKINFLGNNIKMVKAYGAQTKLPGGD
jgi:hypothetical protein